MTLGRIFSGFSKFPQEKAGKFLHEKNISVRKFWMFKNIHYVYNLLPDASTIGWPHKIFGNPGQ